MITNHSHFIEHLKQINNICNNAMINGCKTEDIMQIGMLVSYMTGFFENYSGKTPGAIGGRTEVLRLKQGEGSITTRQRTLVSEAVNIYYEGRFYYKGKQYSVSASSKTKCIERLRALRQAQRKTM